MQSQLRRIRRVKSPSHESEDIMTAGDAHVTRGRDEERLQERTGQSPRPVQQLFDRPASPLPIVALSASGPHECLHHQMNRTGRTAPHDPDSRVEDVEVLRVVRDQPAMLLK